MLLLAAAGWLCCAVASAEEATRRDDEGSALDLQEEVETIRKQRAAGRSLRDLIRVRLKLDSRFVPHTDFDGFDATLYRPGARLKVTLPVSDRAALRLCESRGGGPLAEREGFEPPRAFALTVFKTAAFDRSATSPRNGIGQAEANAASACPACPARVQ